MGQNPKNGFMAVDFPAYGHFMWFDPSPYDFGVGHLRLPVFGCWNGGFPTSGGPKNQPADRFYSMDHFIVQHKHTQN